MLEKSDQILKNLARFLDFFENLSGQIFFAKSIFKNLTRFSKVTPDFQKSGQIFPTITPDFQKSRQILKNLAKFLAMLHFCPERQI